MESSPTLTPSSSPIRGTPLDERSRALRRRVVDMLKAAGRGHLGSALSLIEILRVLYDDVLRYNVHAPRDPSRDRCILSKGHGCLALYAILADKGFITDADCAKFCKFDGILGGHPEYGKVPGVEASTGSLGHGLPIGLGMALAARIARASHRVVVVSSDGECNEGSTWEAALCAGKHKLSNLTVIIDYNKQQSYGSTYEVLDLDPLAAKWEAFRFRVLEVDGHDVEALRSALTTIPLDDSRPTALICHTTKGKGVSFAENNPAWHHKNKLSDDEIEALYRELGGRL